MRTPYKWLLGAAVVLAVLIVLVYAVVERVLPREVSVIRSIEIDASAADVFPYVNSLRPGAAWSPWLIGDAAPDGDPNAQLVYSGPELGVGAMLEWHSENPTIGMGTQVIVVSEPDSMVVSEVEFSPFERVVATFELNEAGGKTEVTWRFDVDYSGNFLLRFTGPTMDQWMGSEYERGLARLKALVEG